MKLSIHTLLLATTTSSIGNVVSAFSTVPTTRTTSTRISSSSSLTAAKAGQAEVVLVGCGAPNRGMGWYHAVQMLEGR